MPDINAADFKKMQQERDAAVKEAAELRDKNRHLEESLAALNRTLAEVKTATNYKEVKPYEYKEGECHPITLGQVCENCGYDYRAESPRFMMRPNDRAKEPHPTSHF